MAKQTSKKAAAETPAADTDKQDAPEGSEQNAAATTQAQPADSRPAELPAGPTAAEVAAFVGVAEDQVFAFKVHPDRAVIVTRAGQRVSREL